MSKIHEKRIYQKEMQMVLKHMERCANLLILKEV